jgi:hypothetical protein
MDDVAHQSTPWSLHGTIGQLTSGNFSAAVDAAKPQAGLRHQSLDHGQSRCSFLCVSRESTHSSSLAWPLPVVEAYVRGDDCVACYGPTDNWPYSPQLYWHANTLSEVERSLTSMSLLVSVQTHLLDTLPRIVVTSQFPSGETHFIATGENEGAEIVPIESDCALHPTGAVSCTLHRHRSAPVSYAQIVAATDFRQLRFDRDPVNHMSAKWELFADFLEKGVIRRARVHGVLLPRENDIELALECCAAVERIPLPLTV